MPWTDSKTGAVISNDNGWTVHAKASGDVNAIRRGSTSRQEHSGPSGRRKTRAYYAIIRAGVANAKAKGRKA